MTALIYAGVSREMSGEVSRGPARQRHAQPKRRSRGGVPRNDRTRRFVVVRREHDGDNREQSDRAAPVVAAAGGAKDAFVLVVGMRSIAAVYVVGANHLRRRQRNAGSIALDVAWAERRQEKGDRLQQRQTNDRMRATGAQAVRHLVVKLPHNLLSTAPRQSVNSVNESVSK